MQDGPRDELLAVFGQQLQEYGRPRFVYSLHGKHRVECRIHLCLGLRLRSGL
jgi:hypothetical protein